MKLFIIIIFVFLLFVLIESYEIEQCPISIEEDVLQVCDLPYSLPSLVDKDKAKNDYDIPTSTEVYKY